MTAKVLRELNASFYYQLTDVLKKGQPLSPDLKRVLEGELDFGRVRPEVAGSLERVLDGTLSAAGKEKLARELGKGLYKPEFLEIAVATAATDWSKVFKPGGTLNTAWQLSIKQEESRLRTNAETLIDGKYAFIPPGAPFTDAQYKQFKEQYEQFKKERDKPRLDSDEAKAKIQEPKLSLAIKTDRPPSQRDAIAYLNAAGWSAETENQLAVNATISLQKDLGRLTKQFKRENWWPSESAEQNPEAFSRRITELAGSLPMAEQARATLQGLKLLTDHSEDKVGASWIDQGLEVARVASDQAMFGGVGLGDPKRAKLVKTFEHNKWMLDAINSFPGDIETAMPTIPKDLSNTLANEQQNQAVTDWVAKYRDRVKEKFDDFFTKVEMGQTLVYGDRDRDARHDPELSPEGHPYTMVRSDFSVKETTDKKSGETKYLVTRETRYSSPGVVKAIAKGKPWEANPYDLDPFHFSDVDSKPQTQTFEFKDGDLVPIFKGGKLYAAEVGRLQTLRDVEATKFVAGKAFSGAIDVAWALSEVGPIFNGIREARYASLAGETGLRGFASAATRNVGLHALGFGLAASGPLDTAEARQYDLGRMAFAARPYALGGLAAYHVGGAVRSAFASEIPTLPAGDAVVQAGADGLLSVTAKPLSNAGETARALEAGSASRLAGTEAGERTLLEAGIENSRLAQEQRIESLIAAGERTTVPNAGEVAGRTVSQSESAVAAESANPALASGAGGATEASGAGVTNGTGEAASRGAEAAKRGARTQQLLDAWKVIETGSQNTMQYAQPIMIAMIGGSLAHKMMAKPEGSAVSESGLSEFEQANGISQQMARSRGYIFTGVRTGLSHGESAETKERLTKTLDIGEKASELPADSKERQVKIAELESRLQSKDLSEKTAASLALLQLAWQKNGVAEKVGSQTVDSLLQSLKSEVIKAERADTKTGTQNGGSHLSADASLVVAQNLLAFSSATGRQYITGQQYALETARIADSHSASLETKMKAISNLGLSAWSADLTERRVMNNYQARMEYVSGSHGSQRVDLEKNLSAIASGTSGEKDPDLRAFAASMLYAVRQDTQEQRAAGFDQALSAWNTKHDAKQPGAYARDFVDHMRKEMALIPPTEFGNQKERAAYENVRNSQFRAALALSEFKSDLSKPEEAFKGIVETIDPLAPKVAVDSIRSLIPHLDELDNGCKKKLLNGVVDLLETQTNHAPGAALTAEQRRVIERELKQNLMAKQNLLPMLPTIVAVGDSAQYHDVASHIKALVDPTPRNSLYVGANPDFRRLTVDTLSKLRAAEAEPVLLKLLEYKGGLPVEPSTHVRLAALDALRTLHSAELTKVAGALDKVENDTRIKREIAQILGKGGSSQAKAGEAEPTLALNDDPMAAGERLLYDKSERNKFRNFRAAVHDDGLATIPDYNSMGVVGRNWQYAQDVYNFGIGAWNRFDWPWNDRTPNEFKSPEQCWDEWRQAYNQQHVQLAARLGSWAKGEFLPGEVERQGDETLDAAKLRVQKQAIGAIAFVVANNGMERDYSKLLPDRPATMGDGTDSSTWKPIKAPNETRKPLLPEFDREKIVEYYAATLREIAIKPGGEGVQGQAVGHAMELLSSEASPQAKMWLLDVARRSYEGEQLSIQTKKEAADHVVAALASHRASKPIEERPLPAEENAAAKQMQEAKWSRVYQDRLMNDIVFRYNDREAGRQLLEQISKDATDPYVKANAQRYLLTMQGGVEVAFNEAKAHPDTTTPLAERAERMAQAPLLANR